MLTVPNENAMVTLPEPQERPNPLRPAPEQRNRPISIFIADPERLIYAIGFLVVVWQATHH